MNSITHNKGDQIKVLIYNLIGISNWDSLSIKHDNIDHSLDIKLLKVINEIIYQDQINTTIIDNNNNNNSNDNSNSIQNEVNNSIAQIISKEINSEFSALNLNSKYKRSTTRSSSSSSKSSKATVFDDIYKQLHALKKNSKKQIDQLQSLKEIFKTQLNNNNNINSNNSSNNEYNPSFTFNLGKEFVVSNLFLDQIILLLDFLHSIALEIENSLGYWEAKDSTYYLLEKTPLFWLKYYHQELNKKIQFSNRFNEIHNIAASKTLVYTSKALSKFNNLLKSAKKKTKSPLHDFESTNIEKENQDNYNLIFNLKFPINENKNDNENQSFPPPSSSSPPSSPPLQQNSNNNNQHNNKKNKEIKHPKIELQERIKRLKSYQTIISVLIGRLTYLLDTFKSINSLDQFNQLMSKSNILIFDSLLVLSKSFYNKIKVKKQLFESKQFIDKLVKQQEKEEGEIQNNHDNQINNFNIILSNNLVLNKLIYSIEKVISRDGIPNFLSRNWFKITIGSMVTFTMIKYSYDNFDSFVSSAKDTRDALIRFYSEHLEEPLWNIWSVIRYDKKTLQLTDPVSLQSSIESLGRMVLEFNSDKGLNLSSSQKAELLDLASRGDISSIMKSYEDNIRSPLSSIVFGDLVRLILIQVQKEKVDVDKALIAIDKLLQSNELNFQLLAAIPSVIFLAFVVWQFKKLFTKTKTTLPYSQKVIFTTLRKINRTLIINNNEQNNLPAFISPLLLSSQPFVFNFSKIYNYNQYQFSRNNSSSNLLNDNSNNNNISNIDSSNNNNNNNLANLIKSQFKPFEKYGTILISTNKLRIHQKSVREQNESQWFNEDIRDLESDHLSNQDKLATINRMFMTYSFLGSKSNNKLLI